MILTHGANSISRGVSGKLILPYEFNVANYDLVTKKDGDVQFIAGGNVTKENDGIVLDVNSYLGLNAGYFLNNFANVGDKVEIEMKVQVNRISGFIYINSTVIGYTNASDRGGMWNVSTGRLLLDTNLTYLDSWFDSNSQTTHERWGYYVNSNEMTIIVDVDFVNQESTFYYGDKTNKIGRSVNNPFPPGLGNSSFSIVNLSTDDASIKIKSIKIKNLKPKNSGYNYGSVTIGGRAYKTVVMPDGKEWLAENLDYKFEVNGNIIPVGVADYPSTPAAWYYNNDEATYGIDGTYKNGLMYNWYAAKYLDDNKVTLLPSGWRVPASSDWNNLFTVLQTAGTMLKSKDGSVSDSFPSGWGGMNYMGYDALPGGQRIDSIGFRWFGQTINYWMLDGGCVYCEPSRTIFGSDPNSSSTHAFNIRLVKDAT